MVQSLTKRVHDVIIENNLIEKGNKVLVAVSGGPDSMTLITILNQLKSELDIKLGVAHVNHKIRKESDAEKIYVENYAKSIDAEFFYLEKDVISEAKMNKMGVEEYARKIRYDFFYKIKNEEGYDKIAIAHNLNDKVETIILNMVRGCSLKGLIGMEYSSYDIIRPMLDITKNEVLEFCSSSKINPCIDKTNFEPIYARNKVRLELIPMIENNFNPNFLSSMARMSELVLEDEKFISKYVQNVVDKSIISKEIGNIIFDYSSIMKEESAIKTRSVKKIVELLLMNTQGIEKKHILDIIKLMENNIKGKKYIIGNKFTVVILKKNVAKIYVNK